jgi:hypothetical protein
MSIPFTVPKLPELDVLPLEQRRQVLARYAHSEEARRFIRVFQISIFAAALFFCIGFSLQGSARLYCILVSVLSIIGGIAYYRVSATQAIRTILSNKDYDNTPEA